MAQQWRSVLEQVAAGEVSVEEALARFHPESELGFAVIDDHRSLRTGLPEVIYGEGKTAAEIARILAHLVERGERALATRVDPEKARAVQEILPSAVYESLPRLLWVVPDGVAAFEPLVEGTVAVISAGTSDRPVAEEAARCCEWFGLRVDRAHDVGVAGLHRLLSRLEGLREASAVIAVAGMEGALPTVVTGLVRVPVIGVPTSVGYGAHQGGLTALHGMVGSCASGLSVVNIDNGFGAAQVAWRILAGRR